GYNGLVLRARMTWSEVNILRAYSRYLRQVRIPFSQDYMWETLNRHPAIAALVIRLFTTRFSTDSDQTEKVRQKTCETIRADIEKALSAVESLDEDRIIRRFVNLVMATLRTNVYQRDIHGKRRPTIAFKMDSKAIEELPPPRPFREIFVYSPRIEGVHLRFGKVARGGLRWSDRPQDFRTEVLGLVKAQQVKNAVIVPVGAKGGFVPKFLPVSGTRDEVMAEGIASYKIFVGTMLEITDNLDGDSVIHPRSVVRYDEDDPYLVVAADKGTATFSDIANELSDSRNFWLSDAFASGGSVGYDHKKMGITARGGWEAVKRHFREMDINIQTTPFTVIGVGDMSGDVFGNGMLLSKHIRLIGAFNHLHIFIDPDPDPAKSHAERKRLFETPGTAWTDYAPKLISKGGGVFDRSAKSIDLTPQMKDLLGAQSDRLTPNEVIRRLLVAPVELLWFGGIGTFIRAGFETDAEVGDRANDAVRVTADALNCAVIGEGGNLGITQNGRIEYARAGGRLNTDAIDNSGGVDASDHEVNIKILVGDVVARGDMTMKQRNNLLARMTDEVADLVLRDNYQQPQALTVVEAQGLDGLDAQERLIRALERKGLLDRAIEFLPDDEALAERRQAGQGLTRPELSVLLAYAKIALYA
ncbi:MAG: NAD-glutamate dehydrogenase, partial [Alphaproteobacteria bacterium]|nr:NAD-glutamate dehydrogenase [Alphaproteobacteria bacterium]